jgi:hypothetical protein
MGLNKGDKKKEQQLQQQALAQQTQFNQYLQQASQPTALQSAEDKNNLDFLDWESGKSGPVNVREAPGMSPWLSLYDDAVSNRDLEGSMGRGLLTMGKNGSNPNMAAQLDRLYSERRKQAAGGALENAFRQRSAAAHGYVLPSSSLSQNRTMGLMSATGNMAESSMNRYASYQPRPGFFNQLGSATAGSLGKFIGSGGGFKGWSFDRGGNLSRYMRRPGDRAVMGETGPEVAEVDENGDIQITPLPGSPRVFRGEGAGPMTVEDLFAIARAPIGRAAPKVAAPAGGEPYADGAVRPRIATPPPPVAPSVLTTQNVPQLVAPDLGLAGDPPPLPQKQIGLIGMDVPEERAGSPVRPRVANPLEYMRGVNEQNAVAPPATNHNSRLISILKGAGRGLVEGGVVGAAIGGVTHGLDPSQDEQFAQRRGIARDRERLGELEQAESNKLTLEGRAADVENKRQASPLRWAALGAQQLQRERQNILAQVRARKGTQFSPDDPLLTQAEALGMHFDADSLNDASSNVVAFDAIDPQNPTQKRRVLYNKVTGETTDGGAVAYVQPVDSATGMTPYQTGSLSLSGQRFGETQRHNQVTEGQGAERIGIARQNLQLSAERNLISWKSYEQRRDNVDFREKRTHYNEARKLIEQHNKHRAAAERYAGYRDERGQQPQWARLKQQEQESLADSTRGELENVYGDVYQEGSGQGLAAPPQPPAVAAPSQTPAPRGRVSRSNFGKFRQQNPQYAHMDDGQIEQLLRSQGVEVY